MTSNDNVRRYFIIDEQTGTVYLRSPLTGATQDVYTFRVRVSDQAFPEKTDVAEVRINVNADRSNPRFISRCSTASVDEVSPT